MNTEPMTITTGEDDEAILITLRDITPAANELLALAAKLDLPLSIVGRSDEGIDLEVKGRRFRIFAGIVYEYREFDLYDANGEHLMGTKPHKFAQRALMAIIHALLA